MNKQRRKLIAEAIEQLTIIEAAHGRAVELLEQAKDEEREAFDNMPESLQGTVKGLAIESNADELQEALDALEDLDIGNVPEQLRGVCAVG